MQITARADIQAPIAWVFQQISDFPAFERQAMRRGADVRRLDGLPRPGQGSAWEVKFQFRGRDRQLTAEVTGFDPPNGITIKAQSPNFLADSGIELVALARGTTRLSMTVDVTARTFASRLLLQSLRLARGSISRRAQDQIDAFAKDLQDRYQRRPGG